VKALSSYVSCMAGLAFLGAFVPTDVTGSLGQMLGVGALIFGVLAVAEGDRYGRGALTALLLLGAVTTLLWAVMLSLANLPGAPLM